jgi:phospholipid/cholesterol/gamma-HCH transport system ATP-binding protein
MLSARGLALAYGQRVIQRDLSFDVRRGSIFAVMGGSGCGKSTVLKSLIGLLPPTAGEITIAGENYWGATEARRTAIGRRYGVLFQGGALWSALTVGENVALPLRMFSKLGDAAIQRQVRVKLALVGMEHAIDQLPAELSGGMRKRAGLARALALDPDVLFFDEPSAGLDPITSARLDDLILNLRGGLGATIVIVSHELGSLFAIADDGVFLDAETHTAIAHGAPRVLRDTTTDPRVATFMQRGRVGVQSAGKEHA